MIEVPHLPDWDERALELDNPACMDVPTLVEWIQRHLETPAETAARHEDMRAKHFDWHVNGAGRGLILACCIFNGRPAPWMEGMNA